MDGASMMLLIALASDQATGTLHQLVTGQVTGLVAMVTAELLIGAAAYWRFGRERPEPPESAANSRVDQTPPLDAGLIWHAEPNYCIDLLSPAKYEGRHRLPRRTPQRIPDWRTLELARFADEEATRELHVLTQEQHRQEIHP